MSAVGILGVTCASQTGVTWPYVRLSPCRHGVEGPVINGGHVCVGSPAYLLFARLSATTRHLTKVHLLRSAAKGSRIAVVRR